jgi:hypothetical protein
MQQEREMALVILLPAELRAKKLYEYVHRFCRPRPEHVASNIRLEVGALGPRDKVASAVA